MFKPILDPFHRPACDARRDCHQHDVGKDRLLDAEAAAGIRRRAQAQAIARHLQRTRHHRMQAERSLEIGEYVVGIFAGIVFGDDAVGFDRRAGVARIANVDADAMRCFRERALRIAVAKRALADDVAVDRRMQNRRVGRQRPRRGSTTAGNGR